MNERKLIREFISRAGSNVCLACGVSPCIPSECPGHSEDYKMSNHDLDPNRDGVVEPEDLYRHFDSNGNGQVTTEEYADHVDFHCAYPESLDHYSQARSQSVNTVPCLTSYDTCSQYLMGSPDDIDKYLKPLMDTTGSTCRESSTRALLDVLQSLINCGVFG